jgi:hypothetical protein
MVLAQFLINWEQTDFRKSRHGFNIIFDQLGTKHIHQNRVDVFIQFLINWDQTDLQKFRQRFGTIFTQFSFNSSGRFDRAILP